MSIVEWHDPCIFGVTIGQPANAILHPLNIPGAGHHPHPDFVVAIGLPGIVYNYGMLAAQKGWIDQTELLPENRTVTEATI